MKKKTSLFALSLVILLAGVTAVLTGRGKAMVVEPVPSPKYIRVEIHYPYNEHPMPFYKRVCEEEVIPGFIADLKKENPNLDEKAFAEGITVQARLPSELAVYMKMPERATPFVTREQPEPEFESARKLGEMALRRFIALDQDERRKQIEEAIPEQERLEATIKPLEEQRQLIIFDPRVSGDKRDSLEAQVKSYKEALVQVELKNAELEAKLRLLDEKAARAKDTVSTEEIAFLQKTAQELAMQLDDTARAQHESKIRRCEIILRQKQEEYARIKSLYEREVSSEEKVRTAQAEYELADNDYVLAKGELDQIRQRLERVREDLARAKVMLAETGGLRVATVIAEQTLECETERAALQVKMSDLHMKIRRLEKEIVEIKSLEEEYAARTGEIQELRNRLKDLQSKEASLQKRMIESSQLEKQPSRGIRVRTTDEIGRVELGTFHVIGEVKKPGPQPLQAETTLLQAIATAGGFTEDADPTRVIVFYPTGRVPARPPRAPGGPPRRAVSGISRDVVDCMAILKGKAPDDFIIQDGHMILVPGKRPPEEQAVQPSESE